MFLQDLVYIFTPKIKLAFKAYLNKISKLRKIPINAIKRAQYLNFFLNSKQKIFKTNKVKKTQFYFKKWYVIKKFGVNSQQQFFHIT